MKIALSFLAVVSLSIAQTPPPQPYATPSTVVVQKWYGTTAPTGQIGGNLPGDLYYNTSTTPVTVYACNAPQGTSAPACRGVGTGSTQWNVFGSGGGGGATIPNTTNVIIGDGAGNGADSGHPNTTGAFVGTTDMQTLTNKTVDGVSPTTMSYLDATSSIQTQLNGKETLIASGSTAMGTSAITSGLCASAVTVSAPGVLTSDVIEASFNSDPTTIVGYQPSTAGTLTIIKYVTAGNVNFKVCNFTQTNPLTPGAVTLNWSVGR